MRLYTATSVADNFQGHNGVKLHWYCDYRATPVTPYEELIPNHCHMDADERHSIESCVDELLTLEELGALERFLDRNYVSVYGKDMDITSPRRQCYQIPREWPPQRDDEGWSEFVISSHPDYYLDVSVAAFYSLEEGAAQQGED